MRKVCLLVCLLLTGCAAKKQPVAAPPPSHAESGAATDRRSHSALCSRRAGKCQHGDLPLPARNHLDRFKNGAYHTGLQENEKRRKVILVVGVPGCGNFSPVI